MERKHAVSWDQVLQGQWTYFLTILMTETQGCHFKGEEMVEMTQGRNFSYFSVLLLDGGLTM